MSDHQRGAYTPQQEVPLQFDPRSTAGRRPLPMALIASATLLVVLMAAVAMYFSRGVRGDNEPPRPVGAPVASLKAAPAAGAQPADTAAAAPDLSASATGAAKTPSFAAGPEQPLPRTSPTNDRLTVQTVPAGQAVTASASAPMATTVSSAPRPALGPAPAPPADGALGRIAASPTVAAPSPSVAVATAPVKPAPSFRGAPAATTLAAAPIKSAPVAAAKPTAKAAPLLASAGAAKVQIGAFSSSALASKGLSDVAALIPGALAGKGKEIEPVAVGGHTLYRASVAGFPNRAAAAAFCEALKAKGKICFVKS